MLASTAGSRRFLAAVLVVAAVSTATSTDVNDIVG
jgi:hypothetical protein